SVFAMTPFIRPFWLNRASNPVPTTSPCSANASDWKGEQRIVFRDRRWHQTEQRAEISHVAQEDASQMVASFRFLAEHFVEEWHGGIEKVLIEIDEHLVGPYDVEQPVEDELVRSAGVQVEKRE